jgi:hypothetical protein
LDCPFYLLAEYYMNLRIKELWDTAAKLESDPSWEGQTKFMEKFAELIVKEMLVTCVEHPTWTGRMIGNQIKEHFGVEE